MNLFRAYLWNNKIWTGIALYALVGALLNILLEVNILPPCLWKSLFNISCPGCGLTHAVLSLIQLDFVGAWEANPLVFIVVPAIAFFIWKDWNKFKQRHRSKTI